MKLSKSHPFGDHTSTFASWAGLIADILSAHVILGLSFREIGLTLAMLALEQNVNLFNHRASFLKTKIPLFGRVGSLRQLVAGFRK